MVFAQDIWETPFYPFIIQKTARRKKKKFDVTQNIVNQAKMNKSHCENLQNTDVNNTAV